MKHERSLNNEISFCMLQVNELKSKLEAIEETGIAYEKEVENMKKLRNLYEERARAMTISHEMELEREKQKTLAAETRQKLAEHKNADLEEKNKEIEERMGKIEKELDEAKMLIGELKIKLAGKNEDLYSATSQLAVVNHLFGQLFSPGQDSLGKITKVLEEHHDLVNHLTANGKINELASTLVEIADKDPLPSGGEDDMSGHLTKVWRLLVELLGHHIVKPVPEEASPESCYKSVDTPSGPKMVISVSQTFLRLKDLILEKNSLMKEVGRLKDLNSTLECRLTEQESRLSLVTTELHSTWGVVNKLKRQHQNLHSHEQVLRYELAQKRLLLNDLKKKLEECKENWTLARAKNNQTEKDWKLLRSEFALRKQQASSAESGYEESPTDSQDEEEWKEVKTQSVSSDEEHCEVLSWNAAEEPRAERRGTLTNVSQNDEGSTGFMDFSVDEVDPCTVLPWTDPEESSADNSMAEECRTSSGAEDLSCLGEIQAAIETHSPESATGMDLASRLSGHSTPIDQQATALSSDQLAESPLPRLFGLPEDVASTDESCLPHEDAASELACSPGESTDSSYENQSLACSSNGASRLTEALTSTTAEPSTSGQPRPRTAEEILQARQDRLLRLEEGCKGLFNKMSQTNQRSEIINSRLTELHEIYGEDSRTRRESPHPDVIGPIVRETSESTSDHNPGSSMTASAESRTVPATESTSGTAGPPSPPPLPSHPLYLPQPPNTPQNTRPETSDDSNR